MRAARGRAGVTSCSVQLGQLGPEVRTEALLGVGGQGAELDHLEQMAAAPDAPAAVQHRRRGASSA